jgi:4-amino-4-deoxy-L-arabinose transferase-like glycosyltransferase
VLATAVALAALCAVRLIALRANGMDLFFDEAQYWSWSLEPAFGYYSKPPLIAWVIRLATDSCGLSEFCIRLPAPLIHTATAATVFLLARRLYDARTGFWAAVAFATLPGVSVSAGIISTDVPLLLFWAVALLGFSALLDSRSWWPALVLGVALGLGLNAKYAMAYFVLCAAIYMIATPEHRRILRDPRWWAALAIAALLIAPNLAWNASNSFATFSHTADNAKWAGRLGNPGKAVEFFLAQFGVFGPILFGALLVIAVRAYRQGLPAADRMLLAFALPVVMIITVQAFLSRAHANWAAVSYVAATVLVIATMVRDLSWRWLQASLAIHIAVLAVVAVSMAHAGTFRLPWVGDPFSRTLGWAEVARATEGVLAEARAKGQPFGAVLTDERAVTAELLYYMRGERTPVFAWRGKGRPQDHYEMSRAFVKGSPEPVLLVALRDDARDIPVAFAKADKIVRVDLPAGQGPKRSVVFWRLSGLKSAE